MSEVTLLTADTHEAWENQTYLEISRRINDRHSSLTMEPSPPGIDGGMSFESEHMPIQSIKRMQHGYPGDPAILQSEQLYAVHSSAQPVLDQIYNIRITEERAEWDKERSQLIHNLDKSNMENLKLGARIIQEHKKSQTKKLAMASIFIGGAMIALTFSLVFLLPIMVKAS